MVVRVCIILVLFLSISKFSVIFKNKDNCTIFLVDKSLSVEKYKKDIENYVNNQIHKKDKSDEIAVIGFGKNPVIEIPLTYDKKDVKLLSKVNENFTDIEKAIDFSIDYFPKDKNRRIVMITDKDENSGNIYNIKDKIKSANINFLLKNIKNHVKDDVEIEEVIVPNKIYKDGNIPVKFKLNSNYSSKGKVKLYLNDKEILDKQVNLHKGENIVSYNVPIKKENEMVFKGKIQFLKDSNKFNDSATSYRRISNKPWILVISEKDEDEKNINNLIDNLSIKRTNYKSKQVPNDIKFLCKFSEIILINTKYSNLPRNFDNNLKEVVDKFGVGLFVVGGQNSFALGGYRNTTLEKLLPVSCEMKNNRKQANAGLIYLIDCSGSMNDEETGVKKVELAKQAVSESIGVLEKEDYVGVLAFSDTLEWIVPFQKVSDKDKLKQEVSKLKPKGGTLIIPALIDGINTLKNASTKVKHMILLTDGQAEKNGFNKYIDEMKKNNISASTLAVGKDCDKEILANISDLSGGRKYVAKDFLSVPQILAKESYISKKTYINNENFVPKQNSNMFNKENKGLPMLKGYIGTSIKEKANLVLENDKKDPILAFWNYGLGKVLAWTSDLNGKWSDNWIQWDGFKKYFSSVVNYLSKDKEGKQINMQLMKDKGNVKVLVESFQKDTNSKVDVIAIDPKGVQKNINLTSQQIGKFQGNIGMDQTGKYTFLARIKKEGKVLDKCEDSIYLDYSPEYSLKTLSSNCVDRTVLGSRGKYLNDSENVFTQDIVNKNVSKINFNFILLPIVLVLFFIDIYLRVK